MKRLFIIYFFLLSKLLFSETDLGTIIISPNRTVDDLSKTGSSVSIIENSDIENSTYNTTTGILQEFGGFTVAAKGNRGSDPGYNLRGLPRKYIRVLVDGIDMSDITSVGEEPTYLDNLNLNNIKNIEILNGSQGPLYGSNAIGGVISINSSSPTIFGLSNESLIEAGSYSSIKNSNTTKYLNKKTSISLNINAERSNGYSSFVDNGLSKYENDGYYLYGANVTSSYKVSDSLKFQFNGRFYHQVNDHDDAYSYPADSLLHYRQDKAYGLLVSAVYNKGNTKHEIKYQPTYTTRINSTGSIFEYDGRRQKFEYIIYNNLSKNIQNLSGIDFMVLDADISGAISQKEVYAIFSELRVPVLNKTNIDLSLRREYDSYYDTFDTSRFQINHRFFNNLVFKSNVGTGYRSPAASELFDPTYGNKDLKPEKSLSYNIGFDFYRPKQRSQYNLNFFETVIEDIITAPAPSYVSKQSIERLKTSGMESSFEKKLFNRHNFKIQFTKILGKQEDGDSITLVPKDKIVSSINSEITKSILFNSSYVFQNKSKDTKHNELPTYRSLNMNLNYNFDDDIKATFKIQNILDRNNITNRGGGTSQNQGYQNPGRSFYLGIRLKY